MAPNSSQMIALLGLLAVAGYQNRDKLGQMFGQASGRMGSGAPGSGSGGAFGGNTGGFGGNAGGFGGGGLGGALGGGGGLGGILGGLLGGSAGGSLGGLLSGGLSEIVDRFNQAGQGHKARSWIEPGPNQAVEPNDIESALGEDSINALQKQTGLSRDELLRRLSSVLPEAVASMTPDDRIPTEEEVNLWVSPT